MGKGIALKFRRTFPEMFLEYQELCEQRKIDIGVLWIYKGSPNKWVLNFPTKTSWRQPSSIEFIEKGLKKFVEEFNDLKIYSVAFPALGCGNGDLDWESVKPVMETYLAKIPADVFIYPPLSVDAVPEHRKEKEMIDWLRAEPRSLPFTEVWRDLGLLLARDDSFRTGVKAFKAKISDDHTLVITTESRDYKIEYEDLRELWSRFRSYGYLRRGIVSKPIEKVFYYLMPILAELPYVGKVELSESGNFSQSGISSGRTLSALQYMPPPSESVIQPLLF